MRPDKQKVIDETWDDERISGFLQKLPPPGEDPDHFRLMTAYRSMRPDDFRRFVTQFLAAGYRLDGKDPQGRTFVEAVAHHGQSEPFIEIVHAAQAVA